MTELDSCFCILACSLYLDNGAHTKAFVLDGVSFDERCLSTCGSRSARRLTHHIGHPSEIPSCRRECAFETTGERICGCFLMMTGNARFRVGLELGSHRIGILPATPIGMTTKRFP